MSDSLHQSTFTLIIFLFPMAPRYTVPVKEMLKDPDLSSLVKDGSVRTLSLQIIPMSIVIYLRHL